MLRGAEKSTHIIRGGYVRENFVQKIRNVQENINFSGTIFINDVNNSWMDMSFGFANRSDQLLNNSLTRYGIASGCKIFTAVAVCQLVDRGKLSFDSKLKDFVDLNFPHFDEERTIHHLLTHTSGIPDYFDEEVMNDFEELWRENPMYHLRKLEDFLPLFKDKPMKFEVGTRFHYNNAGYILLGLIVESVTNQGFTEYIQQSWYE